MWMEWQEMGGLLRLLESANMVMNGSILYGKEGLVKGEKKAKNDGSEMLFYTSGMAAEGLDSFTTA